MNKILGNNSILLCSALGNKQNQACSVIGKTNTCKKSYFRMTNLIISKGATPMNPYLERPMLTSKSYADFVMQNPFKAWSTRLYKARCQFIEHFTLKAPYTAKSTLALDENWPLSKYAA